PGVDPTAPSGWWFGPPSQGPYTGVLAFLLPFIEQGTIYNQLDRRLFDLNTNYGAWAYGPGPWDTSDPTVTAAGPNNYPGPSPAVCNTHIKTYECPMDSPYQTISPSNGGVWDALFTIPPSSVAGDYLVDLPHWGHDLGASNYVGCAGYIGP